jgi:hypothetical protein
MLSGYHLQTTACFFFCFLSFFHKLNSLVIVVTSIIYCSSSCFLCCKHMKKTDFLKLNLPSFNHSFIHQYFYQSKRKRERNQESIKYTHKTFSYRTSSFNAIVLCMFRRKYRFQFLYSSLYSYLNIN